MAETKTWFVTGCSSGFGRALAEAALAAGHRVIATARDVRRLVESMNGRQPGDPARAAEAILALVNSESPPLRLALGRYAIKKTRDKAAALLRDADASEHLAGNLDFAR